MPPIFSYLGRAYTRAAGKADQHNSFAHYGSLENATSFELAHIVSFPNSRIFAKTSELVREPNVRKRKITSSLSGLMGSAA
jgi:hypothetical protein